MKDLKPKAEATMRKALRTLRSLSENPGATPDERDDATLAAHVLAWARGEQVEHPVPYIVARHREA